MFNHKEVLFSLRLLHRLERLLKVNLVLNTCLMRSLWLNTRQFNALNTLLKKRRLLTTMLSSIKLSTFLRSIKTNTLSTSLKKDSRRELNIKLFKSRSSTNLFSKLNRLSKSSSQSFRLLKSASFKLLLLFNNKLSSMFRLFLFSNRQSNTFNQFLNNRQFNTSNQFHNNRQFNTSNQFHNNRQFNTSKQFHNNKQFNTFKAFLNSKLNTFLQVFLTPPSGHSDQFPIKLLKKLSGRIRHEIEL